MKKRRPKSTCRRQRKADRKRRKNKERTRQRHQYRPLPKFLLYCHDAEYEAMSFISPNNAVKAYSLLREGHALELPRDEVGPFGLCYQNVATKVQQSGGEMVCGWTICDDSPRNVRCRNLNRNRYSDMYLLSHAVWRQPNGELVEVTGRPVDREMGFLVDETLSNPAGQCVSFVDSAERARTFVASSHRPERFYLVSTDGTTVRDMGIGKQEPMQIRNASELKRAMQSVAATGYPSLGYPLNCQNLFVAV